MQVRKLHRLLGEMIRSGMARADVLVHKPSFGHPLEADGCVYMEIVAVNSKYHTILDGDGGTKIRANGEECYQRSALLSGILADRQGRMPEEALEDRP